MPESTSEGAQADPLGDYTRDQLVTELRSNVGSKNPRSDLQRRLAACEKLEDLASENQELAQFFVPILPQLLMDELERLVQTGSTGEMVLVRGLSLDIQRTVLVILRETMNPAFLRKIDSTESSAVEFAHPPANILVAGFTGETARLSVTLLAKMSKWRPQSVGDLLASRFDLDQLCQALADLIWTARPGPMAPDQSNATIRQATRVLAVLLVQHADQLTDPVPVMEILEAVADREINEWQIYVAIASDALHHGQSTDIGELQSVRSFDTVIQEIRSMEGAPRLELSRAVGEGTAVEHLGKDDASPVDPLLEYIQQVDGDVREGAVLAVGEYRLSESNSVTEILPALREQAANSDLHWPLQNQCRLALGVIAFASPELFPKGIRTFVDDLESSDSQPARQAIRELGRLIENETVGSDDVLSALESELSTAEGDAKEAVARGFGELVLEVPERIPESVRPLTEPLKATEGTFRQPLLNALTIATKVIPDSSTDPTTALVDFWEDPSVSSTEKKWAKQALGELALTDPSLGNEITDPFVDNAFAAALLGKGVRAFNTRILGEVVGSNPQAPSTVINVYIKYITKLDDENLQWFTLGELRASIRDLSSLDREAIGLLIDLVRCLEGALRIPATGALGEAVATVPQMLPDEFQPLHKAWKTADDSQRDRLAQALGEAVARDARSPTSLFQEYRGLITSLTGPTRWVATQELGEVLAAFPEAAPKSCESLLEHTETVKARYRVSATAAIGEVATLETDEEWKPIPVLEEHAAETTGIKRRYRTELLGEAVLAEAPEVPPQANEIIDSLLPVEESGVKTPADSVGGIIPGAGDGGMESMVILEEFLQTPIEWRRSEILRMVGTTVSESFTEYVAHQLREHIHKDTPNTPVQFFSELVRTDVLDSEGFLETVMQIGSGQAMGDLDIIRLPSRGGLRRYFDSADPARREVLEAVARAVEQTPESEYATTVRNQTRQFLSETDDLPPATRLAAIEVLTASKTRASKET